MKIRTKEQLFDLTSDELAWRKKELYSLRPILRINNQSINKAALLRCGIVLTYAHWEGFVKTCANAYIGYIAMKRLNNNELAPNFIALAIKPIINNAIQSKRVEDHIKIVRFFLDELPHQSSLPTHDVVDTQSNLSTIILRNIISMLGFDYSIYETKEKLLDERLLKTRNQVAHGNYLEVTENDLYEIQDECILLMEAFRTQIDNAISLGTYKNIPD